MQWSNYETSQKIQNRVFHNKLPLKWFLSGGIQICFYTSRQIKVNVVHTFFENTF